MQKKFCWVKILATRNQLRAIQSSMKSKPYMALCISTKTWKQASKKSCQIEIVGFYKSKKKWDQKPEVNSSRSYKYQKNKVLYFFKASNKGLERRI